jgi:hypothetical protein
MTDTRESESDSASTITASLLPKPTWKRWLLWILVGISPLVLGLLQLRNGLILPIDENRVYQQAAENLDEGEDVTDEHRTRQRRILRRQSTQSIVYISCLSASLLLGLLGVKNEKLWGLAEGLIMAAGWVIWPDTPALLMGFVAFPLLCWMLVVLGAMLRVAVLWPCRRLQCHYSTKHAKPSGE